MVNAEVGSQVNKQGLRRPPEQLNMGHPSGISLSVTRYRLKTLLLACLSGLSLLLSAQFGLATEVVDVRLWRAPDHTRVVFDLSGDVEHSLLQLENPRRLVVDIADTRMAASIEGLKLDGTPISRVRTGIRKGNDLRVVFDLAEAVRPKSFPLPATDKTDSRLVVDLFDSESRAKQAAVKSIEQLAGRRDIVVAIDAGHGGEDPGASGPGKLKEKQVVLGIARKLEALLQSTPGFRPVMTRKGDYYVSLKGRRKLAHDDEADVFVSIHADAFRDPSARGASVYALSLRGATSTTAQYLADRENAADLVGGVTLSDKDDVLAGVWTDLSMTAILDTSLNLGSEVLARIDNFAKLHKKKVEQAAFAVLKSPDIPSILVETGFISNPKEARLLNTADYQDKMARAIQRGIQDWFSTHPPAGTLFAWQRAQNGQEVVVRKGDTLSEIAAQYGVSVRALKTANGLKNNTIRVGQTLVIP